ncbi:MAG TPA: hypothetical protein VK992_04605, partial [Candidatus Caenarcaniphilales bacterium]|nr:hypothetical protein [Candidatus Caenarcaniphilales bacterium]
VLTLPLFIALYAARPARPVSGDQQRHLIDRLLAIATLVVGVLLPLVYVGFTADPAYALEHVPRHVHAAFLSSFDLAPEAPWFRPSWTATSLLLTTPLYVWLVRARSRAPVVSWSWAAIALVALATILTPSVGAPQFGYRLSLDAAPLLFLLLGWVFRTGISRAARGAIVVGVAINAYGMIAVGVLEPPFAAF